MNKVSFLLLVVICLCAIGLIFDWPQVFPKFFELASIENTKFNFHDTPSDFLLKEYETGVSEITLRLEQEKLLFGLKFTLIGGILAILFHARLKETHLTSSSTAEFKEIRDSAVCAGFFWAAVIVSTIIDSRIHFNGDFIIARGLWIKHVIEPFFLSKPLDPSIGWENFLSTVGPLHLKTYPLMRANWNLLTLVIFLLTLSIFALDQNNENIRRINLSGLIITFFGFALTSIHFSYFTPGWNWVVLLLLTLGVFFSLLYYWFPYGGKS